MKLIPYFINVTKQAENKEPWHPTEMKHSAWYNRHKKSNNYSYSLHSEIKSSASFSFTVTADCCIVMVNLDFVPAQHFRLRWCCCSISTSALPSPLPLPITSEFSPSPSVVCSLWRWINAILSMIEKDSNAISIWSIALSGSGSQWLCGRLTSAASSSSPNRKRCCWLYSTRLQLSAASGAENPIQVHIRLHLYQRWICTYGEVTWTEHGGLV